jgi:RND family efflux transporter MFP subunit
MEQIADLWLRTQCRMMAGSRHAVMVLAGEQHGDGAARMAAIWPENETLPPALAQVSLQVMQQGQAVFRARGLAEDEQSPADILGAPVLMGGQVIGAVAIAMTAGDASRQRLAYHALKLGCAWYESLVKAETAAVAGRLGNVIETVASTLEHTHFEAAAAALVNTLCARLGCSRASLGWLRGRHVRLRALSHSATFQSDGSLARLLTGAMDEALAHRGAVCWPAPGNDTDEDPYPRHGQVAAEHDSAALCSVPITHDDRVLGAVLLERDSGSAFSADEVDVCEAALALAGPILELKNTPTLTGALDGVRDGRGVHRWLRRGAVAAALLAAVAASAIVPWEFRIAAPARLEGSTQRAVAATQDGFVAEAPARAGDDVSRGDLLVRLDDRDLRTQARRADSRLSALTREYRDALAQHDRAQVSILRAQMDEARAEAALAEAQLERTRIMAPFDGVVVSGDLSQALGSPVERGQVLFELAPPQDYRVVLEVDERDVTHLAVAQSGTLTLTALPAAPLPIRLTRVTPVSRTDATTHHFRVEAALLASETRIRPGMQGIAKVEVGEASLAWLWTRRLRDWLRLALWRWWP